MFFHYLPISFALTVSGLLSSVTNFFASSRTSMTLFRRAKRGARGKEATKSVTKPNWITEREICNVFKDLLKGAGKCS